jgi:hypothetical protein
MSSWTLETYVNGDWFAEYRWNKGNTFEVIVGKVISNGLVREVFNNLYGDVKSAKRAFRYQKRKIDKEML